MKSQLVGYSLSFLTSLFLRSPSRLIAFAEDVNITNIWLCVCNGSVTS